MLFKSQIKTSVKEKLDKDKHDMINSANEVTLSSKNIVSASNDGRHELKRGFNYMGNGRGPGCSNRQYLFTNMKE